MSDPAGGTEPEKGERAFNLAGKVAAITGGGSGIGLATARYLSRAGVSVLLAGRSPDRLAAAAATLTGAPAELLELDVAETGAGQRLIAAAEQAFGLPDIVIANAGVYLPGEIGETDPAAAARLIDTNVSGVIGTITAAVAAMTPRASGDIVVTSSVSGHQAIHWEPVYSASKHAVQALVHTIRRQLVGSGIRIGAVAPGVVLNDLWRVTDEAERDSGVASGTGIRSEDVAEAIGFMLTRPRHVVIRDMVILPVNQEI